MGDEYEQCAEGIAQVERHAEQLSKYNKDLDKRGANIGQLLRKVEEEVDSGRYLTEETGRYLKDRLQESDLSKMTRVRLEKLARQFEATGHPHFSHAPDLLSMRSRRRCHPSPLPRDFFSATAAVCATILLISHPASHDLLRPPRCEA